MNRRFQNKVAESRLTLPLLLVYATAVWVACGLVREQWWMQFACFIVSIYLMAELNNSNALIRIYSRMVSGSFVVLMCMACFLFGSMEGGIVELCVVAGYLTLFRTYQDKTATGWTYYTFLCLGLASTVFVHILLFVPFLWLMMQTQLNSLSARTFFASLVGLLTPYWFAVCWVAYQGTMPQLADHFADLIRFQPIADLSGVTSGQALVFAVVVVSAVTGIVHYWRNSSQDRIRIRQLYGIFIVMTLLSTLFIVLQPQHADALLRLMIINTAPLVAHFLSLTCTRLTNAAFIALMTVCLAVTAYNLWMVLSIS